MSFFSKKKDAKESKATDVNSKVEANRNAQEDATQNIQAGNHEVENQQFRPLEAHASDSNKYFLIFGRIVSFLATIKQFEGTKIRSIKELVFPAIIQGKAMIVDPPTNSAPTSEPLAVILWASVSKDVDTKLSNCLNGIPKLKINDWNSGDILWIIFCAGDKNVIEASTRHITKIMHKDKSIKIHNKNKDGLWKVESITFN
jgi:hemolysin-activating ACP:hemolysin acyltransferase